MQLKDFSGHGSKTNNFLQMREQANFAIDLNKLLWDAYMALDHGDTEQRLAMLDKLEKHFNEHGKSE